MHTSIKIVIAEDRGGGGGVEPLTEFLKMGGTEPRFLEGVAAKEGEVTFFRKGRVQFLNEK